MQLIERFSLIDALDEGAPVGALAYLEKLAEVLEDGVLTAEEAADLQEVAAVHDLDAGAVTSTHRAFVLALAHAALADGKVTRAESDELRVVAALLDVEPDLVKSCLLTLRRLVMPVCPPTWGRCRPAGSTVTRCASGTG